VTVHNSLSIVDVFDDANRLRRLQRLTDVALAHLQLDDLLAVLLRRAREILEVDTCEIVLLDEDRDELAGRALVGRGVRIPLGRGFVRRVATERRAVVVENVAEADDIDAVLRDSGIESLLGVPLLVESRVIGVLHVGTLTPRTFDDEEVQLLRLVADRVAIAIDHARLYEMERAARTRLEHVQAVVDAALANLELDDLLDVLMPRIREILLADTCAVLLLDEERAELVARAAVGIEEEVEQGVRIPLGRGFAGRVAAERRPVVLENVDEADIYNPILREKGIKSLLGVPLLIESRVVGVLHVGTLTPRRFDDKDVELLQLVAARAALAIERAQVHDELILLDQLRRNFVAIASHEVRTPASAVYGVLATLAERTDLSAETRDELLRTGYEQADRLRRLVEQLLDLSRLDEQAITIDPKPVVLHTVLEGVAAAAVPGVPVHLDVPADLAVVVDPLVLDRVLSNLLANAARYGRPPITVEADQRDRHLRVTVEDRGAGVPEHLVASLFERFERGDHASGAGLGLAIARAYARAHGGELVYEPGGSTRFQLVIPQQ
jgi:K+-sensing histidine kinase KdpD